MKTEIKKVKITGQQTLDVVLIEHVENDVQNENSKKCGNLVHEDMRLAFKALSGHLALLCETRESVDLDLGDDEHAAKVDKLFVTGFTIGGSDDSEGVTLIGGKKLSNGKVLNLVAPFQKYEDDEYGFAEELFNDIKICLTEVDEYLYHNKCAVRQLDLFEDEPGVEGDESEGFDDMKMTISGEGITPIETTGKAIRMTAKKLEKQAEAAGF